MLASANPHIRTGPGTDASNPRLPEILDPFLPDPLSQRIPKVPYLHNFTEFGPGGSEIPASKNANGAKNGETWGNKENGDISDR